MTSDLAGFQSSPSSPFIQHGPRGASAASTGAPSLGSGEDAARSASTADGTGSATASGQREQLDVLNHWAEPGAQRNGRAPVAIQMRSQAAPTAAAGSNPVGVGAWSSGTAMMGGDTTSAVASQSNQDSEDRSSAKAQQSAARGVLGAGSTLPHLAQIQASFGPQHDLSSVRAHIGGPAADASEELGAEGFATGSNVAFREQPSLHLAAHEAAHVVQQRAGVHLSGGVGQADDSYERHADAVADCVVQGKSAAELLANGPGRMGTQTSSVQLRDDEKNKKKWKGPPVDEESREAARNALLTWTKAASGYVDANRAWLSANWIDYLGKTSPNIRLGWSDSLTASILTSQAAGFLGGIAKEFVKKQSLAILGAILGSEVPIVGTIIGYVAGAVVETATSALIEWLTGKSDIDDARAEASSTTAAQIQEAVGRFDELAKQNLGAVSDASSTIMKVIADPQVTAEQMNGIIKCLTGETAKMHPPSRSDRSLFRRMLHDWVLEHAGDEEDANKHTSERQWENARTESFGTGDSLDNHPEIFAYQTRAHWAELGFEHSGIYAQQMIAEVERQKGSENRAGSIKDYFHNKKYHFTKTSQPEALIKLIDQKIGMTEMGADCIRRGQFSILSILDLSTDDGACYVDHWLYIIKLLGRVEWHAHTEDIMIISPD